MINSSKNQEYILVTSQNFPTGGAGAAYLSLFCKGVISHGHSVRVYLTKGFAFGNFNEKVLRKGETSFGVKYSHMGLTLRPENSILKVLDDFLSFLHLFLVLPPLLFKRKRVTILVYHIDFFQALLLYSTAKLFRIKLITFVPEYFDKVYYRGILGKIHWFNFSFTLNYLNTLSNGLIVFSKFLQEVYTGKGFDKSRVMVQPNLTDFDLWAPSEVEEKYTIGYSGTPGGKDGLMDLFKAVCLLKDQFHITVIIIGDATFGKSMIPRLKEECEKMGIPDRVFFTGLVSYEEVKLYLEQCKILAITRPNNIQTRAGFPTKLGEYMALKKPVLSTDFGDIKTYFYDGADIILAESENPESIASKIKWMLENENQVKDISESAYNKAYNLLEYKTSMKRIVDFIDKLNFK
ncbi:MAG TPA: glycosyltransferase [Bacteroidales bacterium]|nr:glycosyltransferase [Bacteroidales bacterium]HPT20322.1 glycosyltransferase [Bacteroidales bacterium]